MLSPAEQREARETLNIPSATCAPARLASKERSLLWQAKLLGTDVGGAGGSRVGKGMWHSIGKEGERQPSSRELRF